MQTIGPFTAAASADLSTFKRINHERGSVGVDKKSQIQMVRFFATGVTTGGSPADATFEIVLKHNGLRVWRTVATVASTQVQNVAAGTAVSTTGQTAVCTVSLTDDTRGFLDLLGGQVKALGESAGEAGDGDWAWVIGCTNKGGFSSITIYAAPSMRV